MKKIILSAVMILLVLLIADDLWSQHEKNSTKISADTFVRISSVVGVWRAPSPKWSPDGSQIIFSSILNEGGAVSINVEGGFPMRIPIGDQRAGLVDSRGPVRFFDPRYSPDGKWISYISAQSGSPEIWLWSLIDGSQVQLTNLGGRIGSWSWSPDSRQIAFSVYISDSYDIWKVDVPSKKTQCLTKDKQHDANPMWTPDSKKILYVKMDEMQVNHKIIEIKEDGLSPRLIVTDTDFFDSSSGRRFGPPLVSPDGKKVLFRSWRSGWINYWMAPMEGGEPRRIAPEEADQDHAQWSPDGRHIVYTSIHNGTRDLRIVESEGGKPRILMDPEMGVCENPEWSPNGENISFTFTSFDRLKDLYVVSLKSGKIKQLTFSMPPGKIMKRLVMPEKISYPTTDELIIHGYLYKPKDIRSGEKFPAVVWIHGGPTGQFEEMFQQQNSTSQPSVQYFVQHGYVILQPNIRGSSGYGKRFEEANNRCWGKCDLEDVLAGVEYLRTLPFVDANKIAITGQSYGGMMTMAAVVNAPDVFQAAIAEGGKLDWTEGGSDFDYELGPLPENYDLRWDLSPVNHIDKIKTPIFIICGEREGKIAPDFKLCVERLKKFKKVHKFIAYPGEGHYVHKLENRRQMLLDKLEFYEKYLKGKK